jgi:hypothetical protein
MAWGIKKRNEVGRELTWQEGDDNLTILETQIEKKQDKIPNHTLVSAEEKQLLQDLKENGIDGGTPSTVF